MKKLIYEIILLAFTLTFLTKESGAQTVIYKNKMRKEVQIIYDFNSKGIPDTIWQIRTNQKGDTISYKKVSKVWHSRRASLQVRINPYLYDVIVGTRQVTDEGIVDTMAARLFLAALTTLSENKSLLDTTSKILSKKEDPIMPKPVEEVLDTINKIVESPILNASAGEIEKIKNSLSLYDNTTEIADAWNANTIVVSGLKANVDMAFKKQMKRIAFFLTCLWRLL